MFVCICNGYRDSELQALARQGVRSVHTAYQSLGCGPRCGRCLSFAQRLMDENGASSDGAAPPALAGSLVG